MRYAELKPELPPCLFPAPPPQHPELEDPRVIELHDHSSKAHPGHSAITSPSTLKDDEFDDDNFNDQAMVDAGMSSLRTSLIV